MVLESLRNKRCNTNAAIDEPRSTGTTTATGLQAYLGNDSHTREKYATLTLTARKQMQPMLNRTRVARKEPGSPEASPEIPSVSGAAASVCAMGFGGNFMSHPIRRSGLCACLTQSTEALPADQEAHRSCAPLHSLEARPGPVARQPAGLPSGLLLAILWQLGRMRSPACSRLTAWFSIFRRPFGIAGHLCGHASTLPCFHVRASALDPIEVPQTVSTSHDSISAVDADTTHWNQNHTAKHTMDLTPGASPQGPPTKGHDFKLHTFSSTCCSLLATCSSLNSERSQFLLGV